MAVVTAGDPWPVLAVIVPVTSMVPGVASDVVAASDPALTAPVTAPVPACARPGVVASVCAVAYPERKTSPWISRSPITRTESAATLVRVIVPASAEAAMTSAEAVA